SAAAPSATTSADPAAAAKLSQAVEQLDQTSFTLTASSGPGFRMTGSIDAPNGKAAAQLTASGPNAEINVKTILIGQDLYAQVPGITKAGTWTHVDGSRLPANANIGLRPGQIDPVNTANLLKATTDVKATSDTSYTGSVDLSKAAGVAGLGQVTIAASDAPVQNVPFTATLDAQGRLSTLTVDLPQAEPLQVKYENYGRPVNVAAPAAIARKKSCQRVSSASNMGSIGSPPASWCLRSATGLSFAIRVGPGVATPCGLAAISNRTLTYLYRASSVPPSILYVTHGRQGGQCELRALRSRLESLSFERPSLPRRGRLL
ncbi:MAG TPA: hypothetical protein VF276_06045, partial [Chloroflexia bacterium]